VYLRQSERLSCLEDLLYIVHWNNGQNIVHWNNGQNIVHWNNGQTLSTGIMVKSL